MICIDNKFLHLQIRTAIVAPLKGLPDIPSPTPTRSEKLTQHKPSFFLLFVGPNVLFPFAPLLGSSNPESYLQRFKHAVVSCYHRAI
jgi:hypothetical protein